MKFILLINVKMPTVVGILTFISRINTPSKCIKEEKIFVFHYFSFYEFILRCVEHEKSVIALGLVLLLRHYYWI